MKTLYMANAMTEEEKTYGFNAFTDKELKKLIKGQPEEESILEALSILSFKY